MPEPVVRVVRFSTYLFCPMETELHGHQTRAVAEFTDPVFAKTSPKRSFSVIENQRFGLVFAKTGSINSGTGALYFCTLYYCCYIQNHRRKSTNRLAMVTFWSTFQHDGKFSPTWWGLGVHALPLSVCLPSLAKLWCKLHLKGQIHSSFFSSTLFSSSFSELTQAPSCL